VAGSTFTYTVQSRDQFGNDRTDNLPVGETSVFRTFVSAPAAVDDPTAALSYFQNGQFRASFVPRWANSTNGVQTVSFQLGATYGVASPPVSTET